MDRPLLPPLEPHGRALWHYFQGDHGATLRLKSSLGEDDEIPIAVFFRGPEELFPFEAYALELCRGRVLDAGAGTGVHSLILQERGADVSAVEILPQAIEILRGRGVKNVVEGDLFAVELGRFDTMLMLMNGIGPVGTVAGLERFFSRAGELVAPGGQILVDSAAPAPDDVEVRPAAGVWPPSTDEAYPGEAWIELEYKGAIGEPFRELYVDAETLAAHGARAGWACTIAFGDAEGGYLARLTR
ncbi:MAG: class I SAM-dependent methyltransferase [Gemmatimonadota bacterium]